LWALVVSYSAVVAFALDWLARCAVPPPAQRPGAVAVPVAVSVGIAVLASGRPLRCFPLSLRRSLDSAPAGRLRCPGEDECRP
jgi:hypothetical protein